MFSTVASSPQRCLRKCNDGIQATSSGGLRMARQRTIGAGPSHIRSTLRKQNVFASTVGEFETPENVSNTAWWERVCVHEIMTRDPLAVSPETSVFKALEILTKNQISGIPVVEEDSGEVVGVVTAYDILALDSTPGQLDKSDGFFPRVGKCQSDFGGDEKAMWRSFFSLRNGIAKAQASKVGGSMHGTYCVSTDDTLSFAADLIVRNNTQRAFVLDEDGKLCGVISRGDILRVTMQKYSEIKEDDS